MLYYAGHGIEAGGENFLVPVDADLSALDDAGEKLVPVSEVIDKLRRTVRVAIVLLDACRNNPFPPGATLKLSPDAPPQLVTAAGLTVADTRSATPIAPTSDRGGENPDGLGTVIGFAAEPGKPALDGPDGSNSPYAAALLRHIDAMAGVEFGTVMRMVAEEVYLKTGGRQHPWVNESLRSLLYLGEKPPAETGPEGDILRERRQLLLTIASLPDPDRRQVERVARRGDVPMDALFGMLRALGADAPDDPAKLEQLLEAQSEKVRQLMSERNALRSTDPEIVHLSGLAEQAVSEGALETATALLSKAKARVLELQASVERAELDALARRVEFAQVYARSAEANLLASRPLDAATDYAQAFEQVNRRDDRLAWKYKHEQVKALVEHGRFTTDNDALRRALTESEEALRIADYLRDRELRATVRKDMGDTLRLLGERVNGSKELDLAVAAFRDALAARPRDKVPELWADTMQSLGEVLIRIGERSSDPKPLEEAVRMFHSVLEVRTRQAHPDKWATTQQVLGAALLTLGQRDSGTERLEQAAAAFRNALEIRARDKDPIGWSRSQSALGIALVSIGERGEGTARIEEAIAAFRAAIEPVSRERAPYEWATVEANLGAALARLGERTDDTADLEQSVEALQNGLDGFDRRLAPIDWGRTQANLAAAWMRLGELRQDPDSIRQAVAIYDDVLVEQSREKLPVQWASAQANIGMSLIALGKLTRDSNDYAKAADAFLQAMEVNNRTDFPYDWARLNYERGLALEARATIDDDLGILSEAADNFRAALEELSPEINRVIYTGVLRHLGDAELTLAGSAKGIDHARAAVAAYQRSLPVLVGDRFKIDRAFAHKGLANALSLIGQRTNDIGVLVSARTAYLDALETFTRERDEDAWANLRSNLALVMARHGALTRNAHEVISARAILMELWNIARDRDIHDFDDYFGKRIEWIDGLLSPAPRASAPVGPRRSAQP